MCIFGVNEFVRAGGALSFWVFGLGHGVCFGGSPKQNTRGAAGDGGAGRGGEGGAGLSSSGVSVICMRSVAVLAVGGPKRIFAVSHSAWFLALDRAKMPFSLDLSMARFSAPSAPSLMFALLMFSESSHHHLPSRLIRVEACWYIPSVV